MRSTVGAAAAVLFLLLVAACSGPGPEESTAVPTAAELAPSATAVAEVVQPTASPRPTAPEPSTSCATSRRKVSSTKTGEKCNRRN